MPFTFECGVCHSSYRLDEQQITSGGVKITCPKCLNFFFLKKGTSTNESPVIEHVVKDGAYELHVPPPAAHEMTADQLLTDLEIEPPRAPKEVPQPKKGIPSRKEPPRRKEGDTVKPTPRGFFEAPDTQITAADLSDYPSDRPPASTIDRYLVPLSMVVIAIVSLLFLNYTRLVEIPGLSSLRAPVPTPVPILPVEPTTPGTPRYGFPIFQDSPESPTPVQP